MKKSVLKNLQLFENFISASIVSPLLTKNSNKTTILAYHNIPSSINRTDLQDDSVTRTEFEKQIKFLLDNAYEVISLNKLVSMVVNGNELNRKTVVITFDDGYRTIFTNAFPVLKKYEIHATVFLATKYIGTNRAFPWLNLNNATNRTEDLIPMNWDEVIELHNNGIEIGSHTYSHQFLPVLGAQDIEMEILHSQADIEGAIGKKPTTFAFPFSFPVIYWRWRSFKSKAVSALEKGQYTCACTTQRGHISRNTHSYFMERIVIGKSDNLRSFKTKVSGGYAWTRLHQSIFQNFFKKYKKINNRNF